MMEDQNKEEILEIDSEQLQELLGDSDKIPPIEIPMEWYNQEQFHKGIADASQLAGYITALLNTGVSEGFVLDYILNKETIAYNLKAAEFNVEIAKQQRINAEKNEL
jgi:hypothetical protein